MSAGLLTAVARPATLAAAVETLAACGERGRPLAGGTDLMVELSTGRRDVDVIVDLSGIEQLREIRGEPGGVRVGSLVTCARLIGSPQVESEAPMLHLACHEIGARQIQARATLGGNLGTASPASDLIPVLFATDASVRVAGPTGLREMLATDFVRGYRETALESGELIESIFLPATALDSASLRHRWAWRKVGTRAAQSIAKVVVAMTVTIDDGRIAAVRAAAGSVAAQCVSLATLHERLLGQAPNAALLRSAARESASVDVSPMDDMRSTARYRQAVLARVLERQLTDCCGTEAVH